MPGWELSNETKNLIHQEVSKIIEEDRSILQEERAIHQSTLEKESALRAEFQMYQIGGRVLAAFVGLILGGSIVGLIYAVLQFQQYVDGRIAERSQSLDLVGLAINHATLGQWAQAIEEMEQIVTDIEESKIEVSDDFKKFIYTNYLWILAEAGIDRQTGEWVGQVQWDRLQNDKFMRRILAEGIYEADSNLQVSLAFAKLKFQKSQDLSSIRCSSQDLI